MFKLTRSLSPLWFLFGFFSCGWNQATSKLGQTEYTSLIEHIRSKRISLQSKWSPDGKKIALLSISHENGVLPQEYQLQLKIYDTVSHQWLHQLKQHTRLEKGLVLSQADELKWTPDSQSLGILLKLESPNEIRFAFEQFALNQKAFSAVSFISLPEPFAQQTSALGQAILSPNHQNLAFYFYPEAKLENQQLVVLALSGRDYQVWEQTKYRHELLPQNKSDVSSPEKPAFQPPKPLAAPAWDDKSDKIFGIDQSSGNTQITEYQPEHAPKSLFRMQASPSLLLFSAKRQELLARIEPDWELIRKQGLKNPSETLPNRELMIYSLINDQSNKQSLPFVSLFLSELWQHHGKILHMNIPKPLPADTLNSRSGVFRPLTQQEELPYAQASIESLNLKTQTFSHLFSHPLMEKALRPLYDDTISAPSLLPPVLAPQLNPYACCLEGAISFDLQVSNNAPLSIIPISASPTQQKLLLYVNSGELLQRFHQRNGIKNPEGTSLRNQAERPFLFIFDSEEQVLRPLKVSPTEMAGMELSVADWQAPDVIQLSKPNPHEQVHAK